MGKATTTTALYTNGYDTPIDVGALHAALNAINDYHEGVRMFCESIVNENSAFENVAAARVILAALDAATEHVNALIPSSS